ncbi:MAG: purine-nucleoside phosphorylase [Oscillospiraceae bacterium]|nr:purine-nucleoside phosphorylase [Oscillospiraceae bacterium]
MSTPHISAENGQIAKTVLMPGDPLRAKKIAETFLAGVVQINAVRGMLGFTGNYNGKPVSVMGSGMGMPSIGIYTYELFTQYGVENIIRLGSAGGYLPDLALYDVVMASSAWTESSYAHTMSGSEESIAYPSEALNKTLADSAKVQNIPLRAGTIHSSDVFYREPWQGETPPYWHKIRDEKGCMAVEMESFALFHNAKATGKNAACLLTISDSLVTWEAASPEEREKGFVNMMKIALEAL